MSNKQLPADVQLPEDVVEEIRQFADAETEKHADVLRSNDMEYAAMIMRLFGYKEGYITGATAYVTKLHQSETRNGLLKTEIKHLNAVIESLKAQPGAMWVKASEYKFKHSEYRPVRIKSDVGAPYCYATLFISAMNGKPVLSDGGVYFPQGHTIWSNYEILDESGAAANELEQLRQWKIEAVEMQIPIIAYAHKHLEAKIGDSCTALVIAELDRLRDENDLLRDLIERINKKAINGRPTDLGMGTKQAAMLGEIEDLIAKFHPEAPEWSGEKEVKPKEQVVIHNNSDAFRHWVTEVKRYPIALLGHQTGVWLPPGVTLQQFEKEWDEYEKANNPAKKQTPSFNIKAGLKFRNVHMPDHSFEVISVTPKVNRVEVRIYGTGGAQWTEKDWILEHTLSAFAKGEYFIEKEVKGEQGN